MTQDSFTTEQREFLALPQVGVLATVSPDGAPHAAPMWYILDGDEILISTKDGSQKHLNVVRRPRANFVVDRRERPYFALMIDAIVEVLPQMDDRQRRMLMERYLSAADAEARLASPRPHRSVTLRLVPTKVVQYPAR